ncbi:MAG: SDR family NAD(P)-dependent oxidoreductase [Beijerinckiaceae bacterium]
MTSKTIIIGATGGVGATLARQLARDNVALHLVGRDSAKLQTLAAETGSTYAIGDVHDQESLHAAVDVAGDQIDGLVYAVGTITLKSAASVTYDDVDADFALNARGALFAFQAALPAMKKSGAASVVFFSTVAAGQGFAMHASIAMAKGAVEALTRSLAAEFAPVIRVNCIAPSLTNTPLAARLLASEPVAKAIAASHPMQRIGAPDDIAAAAQFLLSAQSAWITGQVIAVDGGRGALRTRGQ